MRQLICILLIACTLLYGSACNSKSTVDYVAKANVRLSNLTFRFGQALNQAAAEGRLSPATKLEYANGLQAVIDGGTQVTLALEGLVAKYPDGNIPSAELRKIDFLFSDVVVTPVLSLLTKVHLITQDTQDYLLIAITAVKVLVLEVASRLGKNSVSYYRVYGKEALTNG